MPNIRKKTGEPKLNLKQNLQNKYVAFLDVMGFSNLVYSSSGVERLESYFNKIIEVLDELKKERKNVQSFQISDSIILIAPNTITDFKQLLFAIRKIQHELLRKKILVRGAVSFGQVYFDDKKNILVGKGYIRAYQLEKEAVFPRVIIDPAIIKHIANDRSDFIKKINKHTEKNIDLRYIYTPYKNGLFSKISDDAIFIDYANKAIRDNLIYSSVKQTYETILDNLYGEQTLYSKYIWLRDYFLEHLQTRHDCAYNDRRDTPYAKELQEWVSKFNRL